MKLNHINLTVTDAQGARRMLEKYFGLMPFEGTTDDAKFLAMKDDNGMVITLMQSKENVVYPSTFHIGFIISDETRVMEIYEALKTDGYNIAPPDRHRGRALDLYFATPYGFTIQVS